jgi:hypothetical protein
MANTDAAFCRSPRYCVGRSRSVQPGSDMFAVDVIDEVALVELFEPLNARVIEEN